MSAALSATLPAALGGGALFAVCASQPGAGFQPKWVARSADGGRSWTRHAACFSQACQGNPLGSGYLGSIDAVSASTVYLVGDRSPLLVTRDGGSHWSAVRAVTAGTDGGTGEVAFTSKSDGIVVGLDSGDNEAPTIWVTSDGGLRWSALHPRIG